MKIKEFLSGIKRKKVLLIIIALVLILAIGGFFIIKYIINDNKETKDYSINEVEQILYQQTEPYSKDDEIYVPASDEKINYKIVINKKNNVIVIYKRDSEGKYTEAFKSMTCSVGRDVPLGTYKTGDRYTWKIVNGNVWAQYATRLEDAVMIQSVPFQSKQKDTLITKYYNQLGSNCNAYAIRLTVSDAKWIVENAAEGTLVEILEDDDIGPLGKPKISSVEDDTKWDPSDPDPLNPGNGNNIYFEGLSNRTVERGITIDYLKDIRLVNENGLEVSLDIEVNSDVDIYKCGTYDVTYSVVSASGQIIEEKVQFKVIDTLKPVFSGIPSEISINTESIVDKASLLKGIYVVDNNQFIPTDKVQVSIPDDIKDGDYIRYSISDDYGNETTVDVVCVVDKVPPELYLLSTAGSIISIDQVVDEEFALSRVEAVDNGESLSKDHIHVDISINDWGYTFKYTVTDNSGLSSQLQNTVSYPTYVINIPTDEFVSDLSDLSLLNGVQLEDSLGNIYNPDGVTVKSSMQSDRYYLITYEYEYSSPLGTKRISAERYVQVEEEEIEIELEFGDEQEDISATDEPDN